MFMPETDIIHRIMTVSQLNTWTELMLAWADSSHIFIFLPLRVSLLLQSPEQITNLFFAFTGRSSISHARIGRAFFLVSYGSRILNCFFFILSSTSTLTKTSVSSANLHFVMQWFVKNQVCHHVRWWSWHWHKLEGMFLNK